MVKWKVVKEKLMGERQKLRSKGGQCVAETRQERRFVKEEECE